MWIFKSELPKDTYELGQNIAKLLNIGDTICLVGDMGVGKTLFTKGICYGLGIEDSVTSPTFNVVNVYKALSYSVYHFDLYRLDKAAELTDVGFYEYIYSSNIAIIEWPDKFYKELPEEYLLFEIKYDEMPTKRLICISTIGSRYHKFNEELN